MGAAPPRQTEIKFLLPGNSAEEQLNLGISAFQTFGFPDIPAEALSILREGLWSSNGNLKDPLRLSIVTSSEGFVRCGLLVPKPSTETQLALCSLCSGE
jgi:hypothetical protein